MYRELGLLVQNNEVFAIYSASLFFLLLQGKTEMFKSAIRFHITEVFAIYSASLFFWLLQGKTEIKRAEFDHEFNDTRSWSKHEPER